MIMNVLLNEDLEKQYDIIVVDEVQDISAKEFEIIKKLGRKIITLGDFNQGIYKTDMDRPRMMSLGDFEKLSTVFRYHIEIAKLANDFTERDLPSMVRDGNGVKPKIIDVQEAQVFPEIAEILRNLVLRRKRVGVISPDKDKLKSLQTFLQANGVESVYYEKNLDFRSHDFSSTIPLLLSSFSAKGLEFENVIVFGFNKHSSRIEKLRTQNLLKEIIFVSITRCNSDLFIVRTPEEIDQIRNLVVDQGNVIHEDDLGDMFDDLF